MKVNKFKDNDQRAELRDLMAAAAMISLMKQDAATPMWVAHQAYRYADTMLDVRDAVSDNEEIK